MNKVRERRRLDTLAFVYDNNMFCMDRGTHGARST